MWQFSRWKFRVLYSSRSYSLFSNRVWFNNWSPWLPLLLPWIFSHNHTPFVWSVDIFLKCVILEEMKYVVIKDIVLGVTQTWLSIWSLIFGSYIISEKLLRISFFPFINNLRFFIYKREKRIYPLLNTQIYI